MSACCGCCAALRPRYKRLVDNIFPADPQEGLVKSNMDKLTFFAMKSPEKLDRIGEYLAQRLSRDVSRNRIGFVIISMEALDTLLVTCHAQSLNLFVESFLKMVQKLLESNEPQLQCLATSSFIKFANIEEDTPSYHRRYDFFVSRFSTMCHNNHDDPETREKLRGSGLRGIQGVIRKTVSDDLQTNIWDHTHMDKIVPSLLYNMQAISPEMPSQESPREEEVPMVVAETVFRDLVCRASYGNIYAVIKPVLMHLDNHNLWNPNKFAVKCFRIIMYSVQAQYGYIVIQKLMTHLDENSKKDPKIKSGIVDVLYETVLIAAGGSIGPSVLDVFNTLLRHLRISVDTQSGQGHHNPHEKAFQEAVINTIGEFANNLPDYQKIEIMMFVMGKVPLPSHLEDSQNAKDILLQTMLLKTLLKVATKYKTVLMINAFPSAFLEPLLRVSLSDDPGIRRIVQEILHTLLDRHDNLSKLKTVRIPKDIAQLDLTVEKSVRQDIMFMKKNGNLFYWHLYENLQQMNNRVDNFEAVYTTLTLICIELGGDDILVELFRLALGIQDMACSSPLPITHKCAVNAVVAAYLNLMSQLTAIPALCQHIDTVIEARRAECPYYLPDVAFNRGNSANSNTSSYPLDDAMPSRCLFDTESISEALRSSGHDTARLATAYAPKPLGIANTMPADALASSGASASAGMVLNSKAAMFRLHHQKNAVDLTTKSISDSRSESVVIESTASTPRMARKNNKEDITYDSLKKMLELNPKAKEEQEVKRRQILESFRTAPFEDIVAKSEAKTQQFENKLNEILDMISKPQESPGGTPRRARCEEESIPIYEMQFPELFVY